MNLILYGVIFDIYWNYKLLNKLRNKTNGIIKANNCEIITNDENFELIEKIVMNCAFMDNNNDKIYDLLLIIYDVKTTENINLISNIKIILNDNLFQFKMNKNDGYKYIYSFKEANSDCHQLFILN